MKVSFDKKRLYQFYVEDEESDLDEIYYRFEKYFNSKNNGKSDGEWIIEGKNYDELEELIYQNIWKPLRRGDYILQRYLNSGLANEIN